MTHWNAWLLAWANHPQLRCLRWESETNALPFWGGGGVDNHPSQGTKQTEEDKGEKGKEVETRSKTKARRMTRWAETRRWGWKAAPSNIFRGR